MWGVEARILVVVQLEQQQEKLLVLAAAVGILFHGSLVPVQVQIRAFGGKGNPAFAEAVGKKGRQEGPFEGWFFTG